MQTRIMAGAAVIGALWLGGCATEDYVNKHVAVVQTQVTDEQTQQQAQGQRIEQLDQNTKDAMARAEAAGKLAEGKFLYAMVLSDDSVKFPLDSAQLSDEAQSRLSDFITKLTSDNKNVYVEIQGLGDYLPKYAGNLDIMTAAAVRTAELFAERMAS